MPNVVLMDKVTRRLTLIDEVLRLREENSQWRASSELWASLYERTLERAQQLERPTRVTT